MLSWYNSIYLQYTYVCMEKDRNKLCGLLHNWNISVKLKPSENSGYIMPKLWSLIPFKEQGLSGEMAISRSGAGNVLEKPIMTKAQRFTTGAKVVSQGFRK